MYILRHTLQLLLYRTPCRSAPIIHRVTSLICGVQLHPSQKILTDFDHNRIRWMLWQDHVDKDYINRSCTRMKTSLFARACIMGCPHIATFLSRHKRISHQEQVYGAEQAVRYNNLQMVKFLCCGDFPIRYSKLIRISAQERLPHISTFLRQHRKKSKIRPL